MAIVLNRPDVSALGSLLRGARERRGLTVQDIAAVTRIPRRHLDALEQGRLDDVPTGMYRRAEVRAFAEAVGLDRNVAIAQLERALGADAPSAIVPPAALPLTSFARAIYAGLVMVAVLLAGGAYWLWLTHVGDESAPPSVTPAAAATAPGTRTTARADESETPAPASASLSPAAIPVTEGRAPREAATRAIDGARTSSDGALSIGSMPSGARVLVNGIAFGQTPLTIRHLEPGPKRVRLLLDGHASVERTVRVGGQEPTPLNVTLKPID